jgi:hypothetical protein
MAMSANEQDLQLLAALAARLQNDPKFMAHTLAAYQRQEGLDDAALAQRLGAPPELLTRLALCQRPDANSPDFAAQVSALSDFTLIDESLLARVIRQTDSRVAKARPASYLAAFRHWLKVFMPPPAPALTSVVGLLIAAGLGVMAWRAYQATWVANEPQSAAPPMVLPATSTAESRIEPGATVVPASSATPLVVSARTIAITIDSPSRDIGGGGTKKTEIIPEMTHFVFTLPEHSAPGVYQVALLDERGQSLKSGEGKSLDGKTLKVTLDLRAVPAKEYRLSIARAGEAPHFCSVVVSRSKTKK